MDLDPALEDTPTEPIDSSSPEEKSKNQEWERSNRMSLLLMKCKMSKTSAALLIAVGKRLEENLFLEFDGCPEDYRTQGMEAK
ncbi:hypothetical protein WN944_002483 [Citrus x changshan-huyou]|uniref:Uncharacterized protein n=1 Tax=Citrus x changshan-huyou TaxID=2935761 RepID=A0AAP0QNI4_9ROSI